MCIHILYQKPTNLTYLFSSIGVTAISNPDLPRALLNQKSLAILVP